MQITVKTCESSSRPIRTIRVFVSSDDKTVYRLILGLPAACLANFQYLLEVVRVCDAHRARWKDGILSPISQHPRHSSREKERVGYCSVRCACILLAIEAETIAHGLKGTSDAEGDTLAQT